MSQQASETQFDAYVVAASRKAEYEGYVALMRVMAMRGDGASVERLRQEALAAFDRYLDAESGATALAVARVRDSLRGNGI